MSLKPKEVNFDEVWLDLSNTVRKVMVCENVKRSVWNDRFMDVYTLCVANPEPLHGRLYAETSSFIESHVGLLLEKIENSGDDSLLSVYYRHWNEFSRGAEYLNNMYRYLNANYVKKRKPTDADIRYRPDDAFRENFNETLEIGELCHDAWRRLLLNKLEKNLVINLLQEIEKDRLGMCTTSQTVIHGVIHSLVAIETASQRARLNSGSTLYQEAFEKPFLEATSEYYRGKASELLLVNTPCGEYLEKAIQLIDEENVRSRKFLNPSSYNKVTEQVQERLTSDHLEMFHGECGTLVKNEQTKDLANIYKLLQPIKQLRPLCSELEAHIEATGLQAIQAMTPEGLHIQFVEAMLAFHGKYKSMIRTTFGNDQQFIAVLDKACSNVINHKRSPKVSCKSPELLVKYCDSLLRKNAKGLTEADIDSKLAQSITVFKYLSDKDIFQGVYQRLLCRRLIYEQSSSMDAEEAMINRLKQTCGYEFTNKLHRMFTDMNISEELTKKFTDKMSQLEPPKFNYGYSILVLQAGAWPISTQKMPSFELPSCLISALQSFEQFYGKEFSGRKLTWCHAYSGGELRFNYLSRVYHVKVGLFQLAILLLFNDKTEISLSEITDATQLDKDTSKHISSLVDAKLLFLEGDTYRLNMEYSNKRTKFKVSGATFKEAAQETEKVRTASDEDRKWQIQAAIVRIMKARKCMKHNLLIEEVIKQMFGRFTPSIGMIKKSVEALIDKQYIERAKQNKDEYNYVA